MRAFKMFLRGDRQLFASLKGVHSLRKVENFICCIFFLFAFADVSYSGEALTSDGGEGSQFSHFKSAKDVIIPVYRQKSYDCAAIISIGSIQKDQQTKGFLKVRVLPVVVVNNTVITILQNDGWNNDWCKMFCDPSHRTEIPLKFKNFKVIDQSSKNVVQLVADAGELVNNRLNLRELTMAFANGEVVKKANGQIFLDKKTCKFMIRIDGEELEM